MNTYVIHGAPLSGKSTYVRNVLGDNDIVFDYDLIMNAISGNGIHNNNINLIGYVLDIRDLMISKLKSEDKIDNAYIITTIVSERLKESLVGLNPQFVELKIDINTAKKRLLESPDGRDIKLWNESIEKYFDKTKDNSDFYKTKEWERKRETILMRDEYKCKNCSRFGITTSANTVHHIHPLSIRPDLKLNSYNLISLCESCHEKMHNKFDNSLSKLGKEWVSRINKRYPDIVYPPGGYTL